MKPYKDIGLLGDPSEFNGAIGKLIRAHYQLEDLKERLREFVESRAYRIVEDFNLRPGKDVGDYSFTISDVSIPNREWGVLIGEFVHNLRSGLDHAVYAAAAKPSHDTEFPIFKKRERWDKYSSAPLYSVPEKARAIIEQAQPYHRTTDPSLHDLAILHAMWNHDKHRLVHATALVMGDPGPPIRAISGVEEIVKVSYFERPLEDGVKIANVVLRPTPGLQPKLEMEGYLPMGVAFAEGIDGCKSLKGLHVLGVLQDAYETAWRLIGYIEAATKVRA